MISFMRYANKEDAEAIASINSTAAQKVFKGILSDSFLSEKFSFESLKERLYKELDEGTTINCIMYYDDIAVGMMTFASENEKGDESEIGIWRVYFLPEYWGKNLAVEFMNWGIKEMKSKGYSKAALWVVDENSRARRFYEKVGFHHDGTDRVINPGKKVIELKYVKNF